jgi:3-hydroxymyristoyl/3-hydroxydecanoyl-(acyl carrier protein) dehydratase
MSEDFGVHEVARTAERVVMRVSVPPDLRFFEGHFEGEPMLPGIAQLLALAHRRAREVFGALGREKRIVRVKFEAVIRPGDALDLVLERSAGSGEGEAQVRFEITRDGARCASGAIVYGA